MKPMIKTRNFKTAYRREFEATKTEIKDIINIQKDTSLPAPFIKEKHADRWVLPFNNITDIIKNGRKLYYVVYSDCHYDHGRGYVASTYSRLIYSNSKKDVREFIMERRRAARGYGDGRCINCIFEVNKMHPYEIAQILSQENKFDKEKWHASYLKDHPGVTNPAYIEEICKEYEKKYGESVDAWKLSVC